jgi:hypothetical protein
MVVEIDLGIDEESSARLAPGDQKGYGPTPGTLSDLLIPCRDGRI